MIHINNLIHSLSIHVPTTDLAVLACDPNNTEIENEIFFKALALRTGGEGSLLWDCNPIDAIEDFTEKGEFPESVEMMKRAREKQIEWLHDMGFHKTAENWW